MANRGDAANGKARDLAHHAPIRAAQRLSCKIAGAGRVHLIAACGQKQVKPSARPLKQDRLDDLVQIAAGRCRRLIGGARFLGHFHGRGVNAAVAQGKGDTGKGFRHGTHLRVGIMPIAGACGKPCS